VAKNLFAPSFSGQSSITAVTNGKTSDILSTSAYYKFIFIPGKK